MTLSCFLHYRRVGPERYPGYKSPVHEVDLRNPFLFPPDIQYHIVWPPRPHTPIHPRRVNIPWIRSRGALNLLRNIRDAEDLTTGVPHRGTKPHSLQLWHLASSTCHSHQQRVDQSLVRKCAEHANRVVAVCHGFASLTIGVRNFGGFAVVSGSESESVLGGASGSGLSSSPSSSSIGADGSRTKYHL